MSNSSQIIKQLALSRLADIGCGKLPPGVVNLVVGSFVQRAEQRLSRFAQREITVPKVAKLFTQGLNKEGAFEGGVQPPPLNQSGLRNDAVGDMSQSL